MTRAAQEISRLETVCDRCNARAACIAMSKKAHLLLCRHHADKHRGALTEQGWAVRELEGVSL